MGRFTANIHTLRFDKRGWSKKLDEQLNLLIKTAAAEGLKTAIVKVPVFSGFARGAIKFAEGPKGQLAQYLRAMGFIGIKPKPFAPKWYYHFGRANRIRKWPENAGQFGHYNFSGSINRPIYQFSFRSEVVHFFLNEFFKNVSPKSPWHFIRAWKKKFDQHVQLNAKLSVPKLKSFIIKRGGIQRREKIGSPFMGSY